MVAYGINAMLCLILVVVLAPLSKGLKDDGAPDWLSLGLLGIAVAALLWMMYFLFRMVRAKA